MKKKLEPGMIVISVVELVTASDASFIPAGAWWKLVSISEYGDWELEMLSGEHSARRCGDGSFRLPSPLETLERRLEEPQ